MIHQACPYFESVVHILVAACCYSHSCPVRPLTFHSTVSGVAAVDLELGAAEDVMVAADGLVFQLSLACEGSYHTD